MTLVIAPITRVLGPPLLSVTLLTLQSTYGSKESEESELLAVVGVTVPSLPEGCGGPKPSFRIIIRGRGAGAGKQHEHDLNSETWRRCDDAGGGRGDSKTHPGVIIY